MQGSNAEPFKSALGQKRTLVEDVVMSALCQKQTARRRSRMSLSDALSQAQLLGRRNFTLIHRGLTR
jgi:hypothetical protein